MAIKKRIRPKPKTTPRKKLSPHELLCRKLSTRMERDTDEDVRYVMDALTPVNMSAHLAAEWLTARCDTEISTLQMNGPYGEGATYRVSMSYTDKTKKPKHGYLYPKVYRVKSSPRLIHSIILTYIEIAKQLGRFP